MRTVLVTGSSGFIGRNLVGALGRREDVSTLDFNSNDNLAVLEGALEQADIIYHLAGVNRPEHVEEFASCNTLLTETIIHTLRKMGKRTPIIMSSSIQAELDNPYGVSKKKAEELLVEYSESAGTHVSIFRLTNVFGKWSRPNYNSVVATFCYNITHGLEINISDPARELNLAYIDDVIDSFIQLLSDHENAPRAKFLYIKPSYRVTLGELADSIFYLKDIRKTLIVPDLSDDFMKCLYATYLSYLDKDDFSYPLDIKSDSRGSLFELIKSKHFGQMFVSKTYGGVIRGNHYHNTKVEKFCVIHGKAEIKFRHIFEDDIISYQASGERAEVFDIPPGYIHSIENQCDDVLIVLFWADQIFDPDNPDTYKCEV